jgi:hypothetical protein
VKNPALKFLKYIYLLFLITGSLFSGFSQAVQNPFELTPRLPEPQIKADSTSVMEAQEPAKAGNPFDIINNKSGKTVKPKAVLPKPQKDLKPKIPAVTGEERPRVLFPVLLTYLILATILVTIFRGYISRIYQAVFSDNMLHQLYNDRLNIGVTTAFIPLYLFFFLNAGLFIFLILYHFDVLPFGPSFQSLAIITGGSTILFLLKHLILIYIGRVFPVKEEVSNYNFTIIVFSIFIGMGLAVLNLGIAYVPQGITRWLIYGAFLFVGLTYLLRYLRGIFIADKFIAFHKFHFLLYICTVEIAPVLFLYRFFTNQLQG